MFKYLKMKYLRLKAIYVFVLVILICFGCRSPYKHLLNSEKKLEKGEYDSALISVNKAMEENFFYRYIGLRHRANIFLSKGDFDKCISDLNFLIGNFEAQFDYTHKLFPKAVASKDEELAELYLTRGLCYFINDDINKSIFNLERAEELSTSPHASYLLSSAYKTQKRYKSSQVWLNKYFEFDDDNTNRIIAAEQLKDELNILLRQNSDFKVIVNEGMPTSIHGMACSNDGELLALGGTSILKVIDFDTGIEIFTVNIQSNKNISDLVFSNDDRFLAFYGGGEIYVVDVFSQNIVQSFKGSPPLSFSSSTNYFTFCHSVNSYLDRLDHSTEFNYVMDLITGKKIGKASYKELACDNSIFIYDTNNWELYDHKSLPCIFTKAVEFAPNDDTILLSLIDTSGRKQRLLIFSLDDISKITKGQKSQSKIFNFNGDLGTEEFWNIEFDHSGNFILFANDSKVIIWNVQAKKIQFEKHFEIKLPYKKFAVLDYGTKKIATLNPTLNEVITIESVFRDSLIVTKHSRSNYLTGKISEQLIHQQNNSLANAYNVKKEILITSDLRLDDQNLLRVALGEYDNPNYLDNTVRYWDAKSGKEVKTLNRNNNNIRTISCASLNEYPTIINPGGGGTRISDSKLLHPMISTWNLKDAKKQKLIDGVFNFSMTNNSGTLIMGNSAQIAYQRVSDKKLILPDQNKIKVVLNQLASIQQCCFASLEE